MSNQFNFKRFSLLFKKHSVENYRGYLMLMFVFTGIFTVLMCLMTGIGTTQVNTETQTITFIFLMLIAGAIFTGNIFISLGDKRKAIATLTLPASAFEKFLVGWLYSYLFFQIVFTGIFYAVLWLFLQHQVKARIINIFSAESKLYIVYLMYAFLHAVAIYGAIYFKKKHFVKTIFALFVAAGFIWLLNDAVLSAIVDYSVRNPPFFGLDFVKNHDYYNLSAPGSSNKWVCIMSVLASFLLWTAAYFKLKEKQI